ncbi:MAG: hypothetical protein RIC51_05680, partial [Erythrobacter sp.]
MPFAPLLPSCFIAFAALVAQVGATMASARDTGTDGEEDSVRRARRGVWIGAFLLGLLLLALLAVWGAREDIAGSAMDDRLAALDIPAQYEIVSLTAREAVLADIRLGDPDRPDLTAKRAVVGLRYRLGLPRIGRVRLEGARLYASWQDGALSLGALDPLLEPGEGEPGLPDIDLELVDARALVLTDYGRVGIKAQGSGRLDDGFSGELAASAPGLGSEGCRAGGATLYGDVTSEAGALSFAGPVRLREAQCGGLRLARADIAARLVVPASFDALDARFDLAAERIAGGGGAAARLTGSGRAGWAEGVFNLRHDLAVEGVDAGFGRFARIEADGALRSVDGFARSEWDGEVTGEGLGLAAFDGDGAAQLESAVQGTPIAPLAARFARNFRAASRDGRVRADLTARIEDGALSLVIPEARLESGAGEAILAASRVSWSAGALRGNLMTGGAGLPRITGRMEQAEGGGDLVFRLAMAPYEASSRDGAAAAGARLAVPRMELRRTGAGFAFAGLVETSGPIPGGRVEGLRLPLSGTYGNGTLAIGRRCAAIAFEGLSYAALELGRESITVCPDSARAMLVYDRALRLSLAAEDLALAGTLGGARLRLGAARAGLASEGFAVDDARIVLGEDEAAIRLSAATLTGEIAGGLSGRFAGGAAGLDAVPLDLAALSGDWRYEDDMLRIERGGFLLSERNGDEARFEPLVARDALLTLDEDTIRA